MNDKALALLRRRGLSVEPPAPPPNPHPVVASVDCRHLGGPTGETVQCETCRGTQLKVFSCGVYGSCTIARRGASVPGCCAGCAKREGAARPMEWACAMTTVPSRAVDLLPKSLKAVAAGGFPAPWLFVDGCSPQQAEAYSAFDVPGLTFRSTPARVHGNWFLALHELFIRNPLADRYAVFQDDIIMCRNVRQYVDSAPWPTKGYLNLYTQVNERYYATNTSATADRKGWIRSTQRGKGALALLFDRAAVETLLLSRHMVMRPVPDQNHRGDVVACKSGVEWYRGQSAVDGGIVESLSAKAGVHEYIHLPTLVQHTGLVSSFSQFRHPLPVDFPGEEFDLMACR